MFRATERQIQLKLRNANAVLAQFGSTVTAIQPNDGSLTWQVAVNEDVIASHLTNLAAHACLVGIIAGVQAARVSA